MGSIFEYIRFKRRLNVFIMLSINIFKFWNKLLISAALDFFNFDWGEKKKESAGNPIRIFKILSIAFRKSPKMQISLGSNKSKYTHFWNVTPLNSSYFSFKSYWKNVFLVWDVVLQYKSQFELMHYIKFSWAKFFQSIGCIYLKFACYKQAISKII